MNIYRSLILSILGLVIVISFEDLRPNNTVHSTRRRNRIQSNQIETTNRRTRTRPTNSSSRRRNLQEPINQNRRRTSSRFPDLNARQRNQPDRESTRGNRRRNNRVSGINSRRRNLRNGETRQRNSFQNERRGMDGASRLRNMEANARRSMTDRTRSLDTRRSQTDIFNGIDSRNGQNDVLDLAPSGQGPNSLIDSNLPPADHPPSRRRPNSLIDSNSSPRVRNDVQTDIFNGIDSRNRQNDLLDLAPSGQGANSLIDSNLPPADLPPSRRRPNSLIDSNSSPRVRNDVQTDIFNGIDSRNRQNDFLDRTPAGQGANSLIDSNLPPADLPPLRRRPNNLIDSNSSPRVRNDAQTDIFNGIDSRNRQNDLLDRPPSRRGPNSLADRNLPPDIPNDASSRRNGGTEGNRVILTRVQNGRNLLQNGGNGSRRGTPRLIGFLIPRADGRTQLRLMPGASRFLGNNRNNGSAINNLVRDQPTGRNKAPFNLRTIISAARRANLLPGRTAGRSQRNRSPAVVVLRSGNRQNGQRNSDRLGDSINNQISTESQGIRIQGRDRSGQQPNDIGRSRNTFNERLDTPGSISVNRRNRDNQRNGGVDTFDTRIDNNIADMNGIVDNTLAQNDMFMETGLNNPRRINGLVNDNGRQLNVDNNFNQKDLISSVDTTFPASKRGSSTIGEPFNQGNVLPDSSQILVKDHNQAGGQSFSQDFSNPQLLDNMLVTNNIDQSISRFDGAAQTNTLDIQSQQPAIDAFATSGGNQQDPFMSDSLQMGSQNSQRFDTFTDATISDLPPVEAVGSKTLNIEQFPSSNSIQPIDVTSQFPSSQNQNFQNNGIEKLSNSRAINGFPESQMTGNDIRTISDRSGMMASEMGNSIPTSSTNVGSPKTITTQQGLFETKQMNGMDIKGRVGSKMADTSQALPSQTSNSLQDKGQFNVSQEFNLQDGNFSGLPRQSIKVGIVVDVLNNSNILQNNTQSQSKVNLEQFISTLPTSIPSPSNNTLTYAALENASNTTNANTSNIVNDQPFNLNQTSASNISMKTLPNLPNENVFNADGLERKSAQFTNMIAKNNAMTNAFSQNNIVTQDIQQNRNFLHGPFIPTGQLQINEHQQFMNPRIHMPVIAPQPQFPQRFTLDGRTSGFGLGNRNFGSANVNRMLGQFSVPVGNMGTQFVPVPVQIARFLPNGVGINNIQSGFQRQTLLQQSPPSALSSQSQTLNTIKKGIGKAENISTLSQMNSILPSQQQSNVRALPPLVLGSSQNDLFQRFKSNQASMSTTLGFANGQGIPIHGLTMNTGPSRLGPTHFGGFGGQIPGIMLPGRSTPSNVKPLDQFGSIANAVGLDNPSVPNAGIQQTGGALVTSVPSASLIGFKTSNTTLNTNGSANTLSADATSKHQVNSVPVTQPENKTSMDYNTLRTLISEVLNEFFTHQIRAVKSPKLPHGTVVNTVAQAVLDAQTKTPNLNITNERHTPVSLLVPASSLRDPLKELPIPPTVDVGLVTDVHNSSVLTNSSQDMFPIRPKKDFITFNSSHTATNGSLGNSTYVTKSKLLVETGIATMNTSTHDINKTGNIVSNQPKTSNNLTAHNPLNISKAREPLPDPVPSILLTTNAPGPGPSVVTTISPETRIAFLTTVRKLDTTSLPIEPIIVTKVPSAGDKTTLGTNKLTTLKPVFDISTKPTVKPSKKENTILPDKISGNTELPIILPKDLVMNHQTTTARLPYSSISNGMDSSSKRTISPSSDMGVNYVGSVLEQNVLNSGTNAGNTISDITVKDSRQFKVNLNTAGEMPHSITIGTSVFDAGLGNNNAERPLKRDRASSQNNKSLRINQNDPNHVGSRFGPESNTATLLTSNNFFLPNRASLGLPVNFESNTQQKTAGTKMDSTANRFDGNFLSRSFGSSNANLRRKQHTEEITTRGEIKNVFPDSGSITLNNLGVKIGRQTSRISTALNSDRVKASTNLSGLATKSISANNGVVYSPSINTFKFNSNLLNKPPTLQNGSPRSNHATIPASNLQPVSETTTKSSFQTRDKASSLLNADSINVESAKGISSISLSSVISSPNSKSISFAPSSPTENAMPPPVPTTLPKLNKTSAVSFSGSVLFGSPAISNGAHFEYAVHPMHKMTSDKKAFIIDTDVAKNAIMTNAPRMVSRNTKASSLNFHSLLP